jgi:hypothetical protein
MQISLFLHVFDFQGPFRTSNGPKFSAMSFFLKNMGDGEEEEVNGGRHEGQKRAHHMGHTPGRMVGPISGLMHRFDAMLDSTYLVWPKTDCIYPSGDFATGWQRNTKLMKLIWRLQG